jgi:O-antigen ligase
LTRIEGAAEHVDPVLLMRPYLLSLRNRANAIADALAVAVAVSLPWSTSATIILVVLWLIAIVPTLTSGAVRRSVSLPQGWLPLLLCALAVAGTLWAVDVPPKERLGGLLSFYKLLVIPVFMMHSWRSDRGLWVLSGYLGSCSVLLVVSSANLLWIVFLQPLGFYWNAKSPGIIVKDHILQGGEFAACAFFLCGIALTTWQQGRRRLAAALLLLAAVFLGNVVYIGTSRTGLLVAAALAVLVVFKLSQPRLRAAAVAALLVAGAASWLLSANLRTNVTTSIAQIRDFSPESEGDRSGERLIFWQKSIAFIASAPLIGHGTGSIPDQFRKSAAGRTGMAGAASVNPHNQTLAVGIQLGMVGIAVLYAMWIAHLLMFRGESLTAWIGLVIVTQNVVGSLFNSHLFDFTQGWSYVVGVGVAAGVLMKSAEQAAAERAAVSGMS